MRAMSRAPAFRRTSWTLNVTGELHHMRGSFVRTCQGADRYTQNLPYIIDQLLEHAMYRLRISAIMHFYRTHGRAALILN